MIWFTNYIREQGIFRKTAANMVMINRPSAYVCCRLVIINYNHVTNRFVAKRLFIRMMNSSMERHDLGQHN